MTTDQLEGPTLAGRAAQATARVGVPGVSGATELQPIELRQYQPRTVALDPAALQALVAETRGAISVAPTGTGDQWVLTAGNFVGSLVVAGRPILIRPKIPPQNVFALLDIGVPETAWRSELFAYGESADLLPAAVSWFARLVETTLGRGLLRSYRQHEERLVSMRGRVDVSALFRQPGIALPVPCRFDDFTEDIAENRYLRAAIRKVLCVPGVAVVDQRRLRRELVRLEGVADVSVQPADFDRITFTRLNRHYQPALRLARMLLENLTLIDRAGHVEAAAFLIDMNVVFEQFVARRLRDLLWDRLDVEAQTHTYLGSGQKVLMQPDLEFRSAGRTVYVGDTKYKLAENAKGRTADYYQMLAYTTALDLDEGVLIYCRDLGGASEGAVNVRHTGKRLLTYAVELQGSAEAIEEEMVRLSDWVAGRVDRQELRRNSA